MSRTNKETVLQSDHTVPTNVKEPKEMNPIETFIDSVFDLVTADSHHKNLKGINTLHPVEDSRITSYQRQQKQQQSFMELLHATPREIRRQTGPYSVLCSMHYIERRRVPKQYTTENKTCSQFAQERRQNQSLFLPYEESNAGLAKNNDSMTKEVNDESLVGPSTIDLDSQQQELEEESNNNMILDDAESENIPVNRLYLSRTLEQLHDATKSWFMSEQNRGLTLRQQSEQRDLTDLFSLQFNETTVSTIASWIAGGSKRKCLPNVTLYRPIVDTRFRSCCICNMYGHYEVECKHITPEFTNQFSQAISSTNGIVLGNYTGEQLTSRQLCQKEFDVTVEFCDGYAIEQRSHDDGNIPSTTLSNPTTDCDMDAMTDKNYEKATDTDEIQIDGFKIKECSHNTFSSKSISKDCESACTQGQTLQSELVPIQKGSLVTWLVDLNAGDVVTRSSPGIAVAGIVLDIDYSLDKVQIKVLRVLQQSSSSSNDRKSMSSSLIPIVDSTVYIPSASLLLIDEQSQILSAKNVLKRKKVKIAKMKQSRKSKIRKNKMSKTSNEKETFTPRLPVRNAVPLSDGSFKRPRGARPGGLVWDATEGVWVLPP